MKKWIVYLLLLAGSAQALAQKESSDNSISANKNKPEREEWLRDLGFGLFLHWSLDSQLGVVIGHTLVGASDDYTHRFIKELPQTFDPYKFDGYRIAVQAKLAGAKYICLTTKHHSGFCMWDTKTTDFKITNTPYGKDLLREFVDGARKAGLAVGLYYSPEDFKFLYDHDMSVQRGGLVFTDEIQEKYNDLIRRQTRELFTEYGDIDMFFVDGAPKAPALIEAWRLQPNVVVTRGAVSTPEQTIPGAVNDKLWESCLTMGTQWQYKPTHDELKSATRIIEILVETRVKGGNLLLNVGPKPDGVIADPEERNLTELSAWHFINQEAIHNVRPWIVPHEENIWYTASKDQKTVYAVIFGIPDWVRGDRKEFVLASVKATLQTRISVLGQNDKVVEYANQVDAKSRFSQQKDGLHISVVRAQRIYNNNKWPNPITVKLEHIEPALNPPTFLTVKSLTQTGKTTLVGNVIDLGNTNLLNVAFEWRIYAGFVENLNETDWKRTHWMSVNKAGEYKIDLPDLPRGITYEFRTVVAHPSMTLFGEKMQFTSR
ncbi:MAG: alpha-L-fucosidase [Bacteroides sp.]|uniref:alpha-L-fucosidase n=1 Tax=Bacteroides sp. TaxID=29523 RepID=UPI002FC5F648